DRIYYVEGLPTESGKYVAKNYTEVGGGPAATAAVAAARLGAQAAKGAEFIITMLPNGDLVRHVLFGENGVCESLSSDALVID
ncbi:NAD(P)-binding domain-containing protein, partial [Escherichia coli]|uniref:NAD(P)-binding domain-containing protein n=1 Tax=Escherichia coli TaxID=562 RepID=UPI003EE295A8